MASAKGFHASRCPSLYEYQLPSRAASLRSRVGRAVGNQAAKFATWRRDSRKLVSASTKREMRHRHSYHALIHGPTCAGDRISRSDIGRTANRTRRPPGNRFASCTLYLAGKLSIFDMDSDESRRRCMRSQKAHMKAVRPWWISSGRLLALVFLCCESWQTI